MKCLPPTMSRGTIGGLEAESEKDLEGLSNTSSKLETWGGYHRDSWDCGVAHGATGLKLKQAARQTSSPPPSPLLHWGLGYF